VSVARRIRRAVENAVADFRLWLLFR